MVSWKQTTPIPAAVRDLEVRPCTPDLDCRIVFSGLDASVAGEVEENFARAGAVVLTNSSNHRMDEDVPLVIPELNHDHLGLIPVQRRKRAGDGLLWRTRIVRPCFWRWLSVLCTAPSRLRRYSWPRCKRSPERVILGVPSLDILGNVIPFIGGEEAKMEIETRKILGRFDGESIELADFAVSAQCNRVAVEDGHTESISVKLRVRPRWRR